MRTEPLRIACLHTAESNVAVFQLAALGLGAELSHEVRPELLARAEADGGLTYEVRTQTAAVLRGLVAGADAVLLTCSTLGPAVEDVAAGVPVLRVDAALAREAVARAGDGWVVVLCAAPTSVAPTRALFEAAAAGTGGRIAIRVIPCAWDAFRAGDITAYHRIIAGAVDAAYAEGATTIALAQASMAGAAAYCRLGTPLTSPAAGLAAAARS
jgi:hypothetical protein